MVRKKPIKINEQGILRQLLKELSQEIAFQDGDSTCHITKSEALVRTIVDEALKGDQRMVASVVKFIERLDALQALGNKKEKKRLSAEEYALILRYYAKNKEVIEADIAKRKITD